MVTTKARTTARGTPLMTQVWAFRIHCNIRFPYRRHLIASAVLCSVPAVHSRKCWKFCNSSPPSQAGHWRIFALSTALFLVIVGGHKLETENGADPREGGKGVGA